MTTAPNAHRRPRVAIAGIGIESSAYAQHRAGFRDFPVLTGADVLGRYPFLAPEQHLRDAAEWVGVLVTKAIPGGKVLAEVYGDLRGRLLAGLAQAHDDQPLDGVYLELHGAMSVEGMDDAEGDLVQGVRDVVGPDVLIAAPMDLHGNVSDVLVREVDLLTCFRMAPHEDAWETRERSARDLLAWIGMPQPPARARVSVPILLPGEKTSTRVEPARSLYGAIPDIVATGGITDAAIWIGYAWADEPRCHAAVVVTGQDEDAITAAARRLAESLWSVREQFEFVGPPGSLAEGIDAALAHRAAGGGRPYLISDSGDNPGAGGSGDVTWTLHQVLADPRLTADDAPVTYVASVFDAVAVPELFGQAPGDRVRVEVGARVDAQVSGPVDLSGVLLSLHEGDPAAGRIAVVAVGGLRVIVTEFRKAFHATSDFAELGLAVEDADLIVTKIGYLEPTLYDVAHGWTLALTPGPVDQDLERLGHHRIRRPMFPFDTFDVEPDLAPEVWRGRDRLTDQR